MIGRAAVVGLVVAGCGAAAQPRTLSGRVVDDHGAPVAGASVVVCTYGCDWPMTAAKIAHDEMWSPAMITHAVTAGDGSFSLGLPEPDPVHVPAVSRAVVTAAGHAIFHTEVAAGEANAVIVLPETPVIDLDPVCNGGPCMGPIEVRADGRATEPRVDHLVPGTHQLVVFAKHEQPGELRGIRALVVTPASPHRVRIELAPTGTGKSITGHLATVDRSVTGYILFTHSVAVSGVTVTVRCGSGSIDDQLVRHATTAADGTFELLDVPEPPCWVTADGKRLGEPVLQLPATGIALPYEGHRHRGPV